MILDRTWNRRKRQLTISYIDKNGHKRFYEKRMSQIPSWEFDPKGTYSNWDGRPIKPVYKSTENYIPSEFDILEYLYNDDMFKEFSAIRYPKLYTTDIETEVSDTFPDPELAEQRVTTISVVSNDFSVIVLGIKPFSEEQLANFRKSYTDYITSNEFLNKHCEDISKVRVLYQYFAKEEDMLRHFFEVMLPKIEVLAGWNYYSFDWVYLYNRMVRLFGEQNAKNIIYSSSSKREIRYIRCMNFKGEKYRIMTPAHTAVMDYMELVKKYDTTLGIKESLSLDWISNAAIGANKIKYDGSLQQLYEQDYDKYVFYNAVDSLLIQGIDKRLKTLNVMYAYSAFTLNALIDCTSPVALTNSLVFEEFYAEGKHVSYEDKPTGEKMSFDGAYVKDPVVGFHQNPTCYDFASLYPSQIITCNLSFENLIEKTVTGPDGSKCPSAWSEFELEQFRKDPNYFVSVLGHVYKNDKDYVFRRMQKKTKKKRDFFKYRGQKLESELLQEITHLLEGKKPGNLKFSKEVLDWMNEEHIEITGKNPEELRELAVIVHQKIDEDVLLDLSVKLLGNGAYGASSHPAFYFYNLKLASDITAESQETTKYMERRFEDFFHNEWWTRYDLHKQMGIVVDPNMKDWYEQHSFTVYGDTDSLYCAYGELFETFTEETRPKTLEDETNWILKFSEEFLNDWNTVQLDKRFNPRHGHNVHKFELETIGKSGIFIAKKKYIQTILYSKGNFYYDHPKVKGKGVELIKSQTPALARDILKDMTEVLLNKFSNNNKEEFTIMFNALLRQYKEQWMTAPVEDISYSVNIGKYFENVTDDEDELIVNSSAGMGTKGIAEYNFRANQAGRNDMCVYSGKIKCYYMYDDMSNTQVFGFPSGELPEFAPKCGRIQQFTKSVVNPLNRFCNAVGINEMNAMCTTQYNLF